MTKQEHDGKLIWRGGLALAGAIGIALLAFYGLHSWLEAAPPLIMIPIMPEEEVATGPTGLANPASVYCLKQGGTLDIMAGWDSGQMGICTFPDGKMCEEWAMMRGDCPVGGVAILQTWDVAEMHCAIRGGEVSRMNGGLEPSLCTFKTTTLPTR
jgi:hypothetical protein